MTTVEAAVTAAELEQMDGRWELVEGELREMAPTGYPHGRASLRIGQRLANHVDMQGLGDVLGAETGFRISRDPDTVLAPDVAFLRADRVPSDITSQAFLDLVPDLVVEVISPPDRAGAVAVAEQVARWLAAGVRLVWVVYPAQRFVAVHTEDGVTHERTVLTGGGVLPGLEIDLPGLFA